MTARTVEERLWAKVPSRPFDAKSCWEFRGSRDWKGYGRINVGHSRVDRAHRVAYELTTGPIPEGMYVLHRCDNPPCVRPSHLRIGTAAENMADMVRRGRHLAGRERTAAATRGDAHWKRRRPAQACRHGHPWTPENTAWHAGGYRRCRTCAREQDRARTQLRHQEPGADHAPRVIL